MTSSSVLRSARSAAFGARRSSGAGSARLCRMSIPSAARACVPLALVLLFAGCESEPSSSVALRFDEISAKTILITRKPDGSTVENRDGDPDLVGRKVVGLQVGVFVPATIENIVLTYWAAGNRAGARNYEKTINQDVAPEPGPTAFVHMFEVPGAEQYPQCMGLYYSFSARYRVGNGPASTFVGPPHLIQPTKKIQPDGSIAQASCAPPPGPNE